MTDQSPETDQTPTTEICRTGYVIHTHDTGDENHIICLEACDCGNHSILPVLFDDGKVVTLNLRAPEETDPRGVVSDHPRIDLHLNPGDEIDHNPCLIFDTCGPCFTAVWESVFRNGGGRIGVHADPSQPDSVLFAPFRIGDWAQSRQAVKTVSSRLSPN